MPEPSAHSTHVSRPVPAAAGSAREPADRRRSELLFRSPTRSDAARIWRLVSQCDVLETNSCYAYLLLCQDFAATSLVAVGRSKRQDHANLQGNVALQETRQSQETGQLQQYEQLLGFVLGYRPPARPDVLFVWQVGVAAEARRGGLGRRMLRHLLASQPGDGAQPGDGGQPGDGVRYLEATVAPSNHASRRLFERLAADLDVPLEVQPGFVPEDFGGSGHEAEVRLRLGPLDRAAGSRDSGTVGDSGAVGVSGSGHDPRRSRGAHSPR